MGMLIDEAIPKIQFVRNALNDDMEIAKAYDVAIETMRKYQMMQADYNERLKADMVAMLSEIQFEIEELDTPNNGSAYMDCVEIIQQKINSLKAEIEPQINEG